MTTAPKRQGFAPAIAAARAAPVTTVGLPTPSCYAGVGSRETPPPVLQRMRELARELALEGFELRSGAAPGADTAFEEGCDAVGGAKSIILPWAGFQGRQAGRGTYLLHNDSEAMLIASQLHPAWHYLKPYARKLHSRNVAQLRGLTLDQSACFALLWTKDGAQSAAETSRDTGGTGMAIRVASLYGVPVVNMNRAGWEDRLRDIRAAVPRDVADAEPHDTPMAPRQG